jgi:DNA-binding transcriptional ArsR family regulator
MTWTSSTTRLRSKRNLESLLGRTRAAALHVTAEGCTTSELARRPYVTAAAASQHATVLRNTDLITTSRRGGSVLHLITPWPCCGPEP